MVWTFIGSSARISLYTTRRTVIQSYIPMGIHVSPNLSAPPQQQWLWCGGRKNQVPRMIVILRLYAAPLYPYKESPPSGYGIGKGVISRPAIWGLMMTNKSLRRTTFRIRSHVRIPLACLGSWQVAGKCFTPDCRHVWWWVGHAQTDGCCRYWYRYCCCRQNQLRDPPNNKTSWLIVTQFSSQKWRPRNIDAWSIGSLIIW